MQRTWLKAQTCRVGEKARQTGELLALAPLPLSSQAFQGSKLTPPFSDECIILPGNLQKGVSTASNAMPGESQPELHAAFIDEAVREGVGIFWPLNMGG